VRNVTGDFTRIGNGLPIRQVSLVQDDGQGDRNMAREVASKNIDGIADLVVIAPIKEGFINAYENITYSTRLRIVAEALNRIRISAREHEFTVPFSDVTERILTLLDFRIGVLDKNLFELQKVWKSDESEASTGRREGHTEYELQSRRYLYLTATFDTALEPYMRLIWDPLGPFLDLLFINCEGYVTAGDHSCEAFLDWVRQNQMDSSIFYATTGNSIQDDLYYGKVDRLLREVGSDDRELEILRKAMPSPEQDAHDVRANTIQTLLGHGDLTPFFKVNELALEVLTVLFRLADYFPPEWLFDKQLKSKQLKLTEGKYLARVAYSVLKGWDELRSPALLAQVPALQRLFDGFAASYREPFEWYDKASQALKSGQVPKQLERKSPADLEFKPSEIQGGILKSQGGPDRPMLHGALLMLGITNTEQARTFLRGIAVNFEAGEGAGSSDGFYRNIAFTHEGLKRIGLDLDIIDEMPKEFREGMHTRSGLIGDLRENHPRRWQPPVRNWPHGAKGKQLPVDIHEIDIVIQLRYAPAKDSDPADPGPMIAEIERIAQAASASGAALLAYEQMNRLRPAGAGAGDFADHFGFADGISQPEVIERAEYPVLAAQTGIAEWNNHARLGEVLVGYRNDRDDFAPVDDDGKIGRPSDRNRKKQMRELTFNGTFMAIRKLGQNVAAFDRIMIEQSTQLKQQGFNIDKHQLAYQIIGRKRDGSPLIGGAVGQNGFDYRGDQQGQQCPFASHIRRTNPRDVVHGRKTPRILRRGMSYGPPYVEGENTASAPDRGLMFMCYQSSLAEQFEVIQRWINGGNSTGISSAQNDPLLGVSPKASPDQFGRDIGQKRLFQFEWEGKVARIEMDEQFVSLRWGVYLFVPSRSALEELRRARQPKEIRESVPDLTEFRENTGRDWLNRITNLPDPVAKLEWKRLLEDFDSKDPGELALTPDVWSAIRWYKGGSYRLQKLDEVSGNLVDLNFENKSVSAGSGFGIWERIKQTFSGTQPTSMAFEEIADNSSASASKGSPDEKPLVIVAGRDQVMQVLGNWKSYSVEEQLSRIEKTSGSIYVTQQPDDRYSNESGVVGNYNYEQESVATNDVLMKHTERDGFRVGHAAGSAILRVARERAKNVPINPRLDYFKLELRRQYVMPALGVVCSAWFGIPGPLAGDDPDGLRAIMLNGGWNWNPATDPENLDGPALRAAQCPGDCLSPSRATFYPRPTESIKAYAEDHGPAIRKAGEMFVDKYFDKAEPPGSVSKGMFAAMKEPNQKNPLARNLIGIMVGAMPPMDGNLRGILVEWLNEKTLWRIQAAYLRNLDQGQDAYDAAYAALWIPMTRAICKRPAPDLLYRNAIQNDVIKSKRGESNTAVKKGDRVIVSLVAAAQQSLMNNPDGEGDVSVIFGGKRKDAWQRDHVMNAKTDEDRDHTVHACPAQKMAMGAMMGILAALLESGRIQALPASLILKIKDWREPAVQSQPPGDSSQASESPQ
jgi:Dyp-type peroxidase family